MATKKDQEVEKVPFEGRTAEMKKESLWLASEDIEGLGDIKVTIEGVYRNNNVKTDNGRTENNLYSIRFEGKKKELILNATNRQRIKRMYGANTSEWKGKQIALYVDPSVKLVGGGTGPGIRVREKRAS